MFRQNPADRVLNATLTRENNFVAGLLLTISVFNLHGERKINKEVETIVIKFLH